MDINIFQTFIILIGLIKTSEMENQQDSIQKSEDHVDQQLTSQQATKPVKPVKIDIDPTRPRYGRMIVFIQKGPIFISIGPDYLCFIGGFIFFLLLAYFLCRTVSSVFENQGLIYFTYGLSFLQCGSYFLVALSNPGLSLKQNNPIKQFTTQNQHRVCKKCGAQMSRRTYHCRECDVCVKGYDHHCPWTSKCIGQRNLYLFYLFVTVTPIYIIAFMGLMMGCLMLSAQQANQNLTVNK